MTDNTDIFKNVVYSYIYHFSMGVQRHHSGFNLHVAPGNIMGKRFANDFDAQPVQRNDTL